MINQDKMYIYMISDAMAHYTMSDISFEKNIKVINKDVLFKNRVINYISKIYLSLKINSIVDLPFKKFWYKKLLNPYKNKEMIFIISPSWYNKQLISYLRKRYLNCKIILFFHDIVAKDLKHNKQLDIIEARKQVDKIIVYNKEDAEKYNVIYHPAGYSPLAGSQLAEFPHTDVVFIGAAKNRLVDIRKAYKLFTDNNLTCFFYVTEVSEEERCCDGIIYGDKFLPYNECLARENSADCLLEIIQEGSSGRTYRMMDAIIFNKKLITNCTEVLDLPYYKSGNIMLYNSIEDINVEFVKNKKKIDYGYKGEFSNTNFLSFIDSII